MCKETQYYYGLCHHKGWKTFDYCRYAYDSHDDQGRPAKMKCGSSDTTRMEIPGLCHECGVRCLAAEREALAARDSRDPRDPRPRDPRDSRDSRDPRDPRDPSYPWR